MMPELKYLTDEAIELKDAWPMIWSAIDECTSRLERDRHQRNVLQTRVLAKILNNTEDSTIVVAKDLLP